MGSGNPAQLVACCEEAGFENLILLASVDSTNDLGRRVLEAVWTRNRACPRLAIVALEQTAGRGRTGRSWISDRGQGVYVTVIVGMGQGRELETLPMLVGVGLARALRDLGCPVGLKWPNDLQVAGRKIGGVLIETSTRGLSEVAAIIGFGINHGHRRGALPTPTSTSLRLELDELPDPAMVTGALLRGLAVELSHLGEVDYTRRSYEAMSVHQAGEPLRCRLGSRPVEGTFVGFDRRGYLRLQVGDREELLASGEVLE